jgi:hypothetical protein
MSSDEKEKARCIKWPLIISRRYRPRAGAHFNSGCAVCQLISEKEKAAETGGSTKGSASSIRGIGNLTRAA